VLYLYRIYDTVFLFPTLIPQGQQNVFHHVVIKIRQLFLRPPDINPPCYLSG
jgi:hypothetical protein